MDDKKIEILRETGHYLSVPKGISMRPMLKSKENVVDIVPYEGLLKKYDLVLYHRRSDDMSVLHRIVKVREHDYVIYGDNCWQTEIVPHEDVIGVASSFYRRGKWISVEDTRYKLYVHLWCDLLPLRRILFRCRDKIKKIFYKLKKK